MITDSIQHQQNNLLIQKNGLRKAAESPAPPQLTKDESSMIEKKFKPSKPLALYNMNGNVRNEEPIRGNTIDTRV